MTHPTHRARTAALCGGLLALTLLLAACGDDSTTAGSRPDNGSTSSRSASVPRGTPASGPHNDADVAFATGMVPHHGQAVGMAELARSRAASPQVTELAADIRAAQGPEIVQMSGWLAGWDEDVPDPDSMAAGTEDDMSDMSDMSDDTSSGMEGMMSSKDMSELAAASGAAFDTLWLTGMVAHHEGAVAMAQVELANGTNPDAKQLARDIIASQQAEIATMRDLLAG